jgi:EmrB/QacA subfamily drug resistance transporter
VTTTAKAPAATVTTDPPAYRWRWVALFVILAAEVMDLLDALVTTIAGPSIRADIGGSESLIQWLAAGYTLAMAVGLITGGRLGDLYGRKRMFIVGAAGFVTASLLCALAQSPEMLVGSRVLQGLFGAILIPQGLGLIKDMFPPSQVAAAFGMFGPVMGLSAVGGPILAGWLVTADLFGTGWRMIFLINLPIGITAIAGAVRFLPESRARYAARLDLGGVGLVSLATFLLIFPLVQGREAGWPAWTFASMAASVAVFAVFGWYEVRRQRAGADPLVVPALFRRRAFTGGLAAGVAYFAAMMGFNLAFSLYLQLGLGYSPLRTGLASVPAAAGVIAGFGIAMAGGLAQRHGRAVMRGGLTVMAAASVGFAVIVHGATAAPGIWSLVPALAGYGVGMGLVMAPFFDIILAGVAPEESGSASGTLNAVQQFSGALGVAALGTLFFDQPGFGAGIEVVLWACVGLLALTFVLSALLPRRAREEVSA